jgi:hypothetical protein
MPSIKILYLNGSYCGTIKFIIINIMALKPFIRPWLLDSLERGLADWKAATYIENKHTDIHVLSGIRTQNPIVRLSEDSSCLKLCSQCDEPKKCMYAYFMDFNRHFAS